MSTMLFVLCVALLTTAVRGLDLTRTYESGPVQVTEAAAIYHEVDVEADNARFALVLNDSTVIKGDFFWMGLGIGEATSGSMLGADIVTAEMPPGAVDNCTLTDRYVPFVAYPLLEVPRPFPVPDECEEPDWQLVSCQRDVTGSAILEVERPLSVKDEKQDRPILAGPSSVLHAYGGGPGGFGYHGANRQSEKITLFQDESSDELGGDIPEDADGMFDILATNYSIPTDITTYACTSMRIPLEEGKPRMLVAVEPLIEDGQNSMVHHFTLYLCSGAAYAKATETTVRCGNVEPYGPLGNPPAKCSTFVFGYAKGVDKFVYPDDVGIELDGAKPFLVMETHFDNPTGRSGVMDSSGLRVHYTNTLRKHRAGSLLVGDSLVSRAPDKVVSGFRYQHTCPTECTSRLSEPINMFSSFLHMHTTGKQIYTNIYSANDTYIANLNKVNFWSDSFQQTRRLQPPVQLEPGQQLQVVCEYDTSKRPNTRFGLSTTDEMCMDFVLYWPLQTDATTGHEINLCVYSEDDSEEGERQPEGLTICAENGKLDEFFANPRRFPMSENPAFNDTVGAPTEFATTGVQCDALTQVPTQTPAPSSPKPSPSSTSAADNEAPSASSPSPSMFEDATEAPDENENAEARAESGSTCFPARATTRLRDGRRVRMDELRIGDEVSVGGGQFSSVFAFTHTDTRARARFVELAVSAGWGNATIALTEGHFLYAGGSMRRACDVRVGDTLLLESGLSARVAHVSHRTDTGLYNPHTLQGDIAVDGVVATTFTEAVYPPAAMALLAPLRALATLFPWTSWLALKV